MAYYAYKVVRDQLPQWIEDACPEDFDHDANYDGGQWYKTSAYISFLERRIKELEGDLHPEPEDIKIATDELA